MRKRKARPTTQAPSHATIERWAIEAAGRREQAYEQSTKPMPKPKPEPEPEPEQEPEPEESDAS